MKTLIKHYLIDTISLYLISIVVGGMVFEKGIETLLLTGLVLMLTTLIVRPIINLLLLPINLITFGLFKWVTYALTLFLVTIIVPGFKITQFVFAGFSSVWLSFPPIVLSGFLAFIAFSFLISFVSSLVYWLIK